MYQTEDGRWRATLDLGWEHGKRQRKYLSGATKAAVGRAVREALAQVESGVPLTRDGAGPTVEEWLWYWHDTIQARRVREAILSAQEVVIRRHLVPHIGRLRLRKLTPEHVESMLVRLEGPGFDSTSVLEVHRCLSRSLVVAMVFRQSDGRPVAHGRDHADWKALLTDAGVRDARLHDARHIAASLLLLLKVPARVVMEMTATRAIN